MRLTPSRLVLASALVAAVLSRSQGTRLLLAIVALALAALVLLVPSLKQRDREAKKLTPQNTAFGAPAAAQPTATGTPTPSSFSELRAIHARPALALRRAYPPTGHSPGRSYMGGVPSLPAGVSWPRAESDSGCMPAGTPLHFLAQIDLAEQSWLPDHFPTSGTLLFFGMLPEGEGYYWGTSNDSRVLYDPLSQGTPTLPPTDLLPIDKAGGFSRAFGEEEPWHQSCTWPHWPLLGHRIETMPDPDALPLGVYGDEAHDRYSNELNQFRAEQAAAAFGLDLAALAEARCPTTDELLNDPDFPHVTRFIGLFARALRRSTSDASAELNDQVGQWIAWADSRPAGEAVGAEAAHAFRALVEQWPWSAAIFDGRDRLTSTVVERLVREAANDRMLAEHLPESFYRAALHEHALIWPEANSGWRTDGQTCWRVNHHQMGGFVPSSQGCVGIDHPQICLLQLQSDYGADAMLCDVGEADFWIRPEDLARAKFSNVEGDTRGG